MAILGKVSLKTIINVGVVEIASTIVLCYCLAVGLGHKKPWLPTISGCGENPPEEHFFRWGIFVSSLFPMVQAVVMRAAGRVSKATSSLGFVAGLCLSGVAVVQANEATHVHSILAVTFFVCEDIKNFLLVMDDHSRMSQTALVSVLASNSVASLATIAKISTYFIFSVSHHGFPFLAVIEWTNTIALLICEASIATGVGSLFVGEVEDSSSSQTDDRKKELKSALSTKH